MLTNVTISHPIHDRMSMGEIYVIVVQILKKFSV